MNVTGFTGLRAVSLSEVGPDSPSTQLESGAADPSTGRLLDGPPRRTYKSPAELAKNAKPSGYTYDVDSRKFATGSIAASLLGRITPEECVQHYLDGYTAEFWYKDRFSSCRAQGLQADYQVCQNGKCRVIGQWRAKAGYVFNMNDNARSAEIGIRIWDAYYDPGVPNTANVTFSVACWDPAPTGPSCNPVTSVFGRTLGNWESVGYQSLTVTFEGESMSLPDDPALNERRSFYDLMPYFYLGNGTAVSGFLDQPDNHLRCDIARTAVNTGYARGSNCVFHKVAGNFIISASEGGEHGVAESAQFIRQAQSNIWQTYPGVSGSFVPGQLGKTAPLSRMFYDLAFRKANRDRSVASCVTAFGPNYAVRNDTAHPTWVNDCDEYPFAATHQGTYASQSGLTPGSYAVRALLAFHNQEVGSRLGHWMAEDHLLEEDEFYTTVID